MENINSRINYNKINQNPRYNINKEFQNNHDGKSFENISPKRSENLNFNTYNISTQNQNSRLLNLEKYNNIRPITQPKRNLLNSNFNLHCPSCQCPNTYYHVHHFHIPHNYTHLCPRLNKIENDKSNQDLLNEIAELKEECKKFKNELEKTKSENEIGNKYIKLLENKINSKQYNLKDEEDNIENKYHSMLDKSFEVLNSVSNKCDDDRGKLKGNILYYAKKEPDYDSLIEAQKRWLDNLPERYSNFTKNNFNNNLYNNSTFSNTNDKFGDIDNDNSHYNEKYFNNMRNFNKTEENINNRKDNLDIFINNKNPNTFPDLNMDDNINNNVNDYNQFNNNIVENKEPDLEEQIPQDINDNEQEEEMLQENENNEQENPEEEGNPLNEKYLIIDKDGNPITISGQQVFGMKLIPLIGDDGKEELDENGNIILIGPDGQPKSQEELEPILLDNDEPLVNEENRPFLGFNGIPLINEYGCPILGPGELYDRNNKVVKGVLGIVQNDNIGNDQKMLINQNDNINDKDKENNISEEQEGNEKDNDMNNKNIDINKLRPLIGDNGLPVRDSENNFVFLDENNKPVKNTGLYLLLDHDGKPVLNSNSEPIYINSEGKPLNLVDDDKNKNFISNNFINSMINPKGNDLNNIDNIPENEDENKIKGYIKNLQPKSKKLLERKKPENASYDRYNKILINQNQNLRDKRNKGQFTYSEVSSDETKKIQFMNNSAEYKGNCFACDVGCSVSKSGYSPMNYVPYNNMIRRREVTPIKREKTKKNKGTNNIKVINDENNYYLTEE